MSDKELLTTQNIVSDKLGETTKVDPNIKILAEKWYNDIVAYSTCVVNLKIKKIDGVDVDVTITFGNDDSVEIFDCVLDIETPFIWDCSGKCFHLQRYQSKLIYKKSLECSTWTIGMIEKSIIRLQQELKEFKYHKRTNKFMNKQDIDMYDAEVSVFETDNVKYVSDECCVCQEVTSSKTECNHSLCLSCWSSLKIQHHPGFYDDDEYENHMFMGVLCPLCRKFMARSTYN